MRSLNLKRWIVVILLLFIATISTHAQTKIGTGDQPQLTTDREGVVRLIYGEGEKIFYSISKDNGKTFHQPIEVGQIAGMHLGMTRGPQLATSKDYSIVTAMDKNGNVHAFRLSHKTNRWEKISLVNDSEGSAPEGLMNIAADEENNFYAVWLDLREGRQNNICFSKSNSDGTWTKNKFIYKSPNGHVCECCRPSVAVNGQQVIVMFRNWVMGSRDLYLISSTDKGTTFTDAQKLGNGTWTLNACPMDGGGVSIASNNLIHTAWRRQDQVFYAMPGQMEESLGEGRSVGLNGNIIYWQKGNDLIIKRINGVPMLIGQGTALAAIELKDTTILAVWRQDEQIVFHTLK